MSDDVRCPYCGADQEINHDDGYGYEEDVKHEQECGSCEKTFVYTTTIYYLYDSKKADCLNGSEHDWQRITGSPPEHFENRRRCSMCAEETTVESTQ